MKPLLHRLRAIARRWAAPCLALAALLCIVIGTIIVTSVSRQRLHLDDGTVWVTSLANRKAARLNVRAGETDATIDASAARFDVLQQGDGTVLDDGGDLHAISAATARSESVAIPGDADAVVLGGNAIATLDGDSGAVRIGTLPTMAGVDADGPVRTELGRGGRIAADFTGVIYGYRPVDGMVLAMRADAGDPPQELGSLSGGESLYADGFGVVDGVPIVLSGVEVRWPGGSVELDVDASVPPVLQSPPMDDSQRGWVAVGHAGSLSVVDLHTGSVRSLASGGAGKPATPVSVEGCVHAAWAQPSSNHLALCAPDGEASFGTLDDVNESSQLVFRANHRLVTLNDVAAGSVWDPASSASRIAIQWDTKQDEEQPSSDAPAQSARYRREFRTSCSAQSGRIRAADDDFGVRAGARASLDVLRNDEQTDCSVLRIVSVGSLSDPAASVAPVYDGRQLQFDASRATPGAITFSYVIDDGRGQTSSARVTVRVQAGGEGAPNTAPRQVDVPPEYDVEQNALLEINALAGFMDEDGDRIALAGARTERAGEASVAARPDGKLTFNAGSLVSGHVAVQLSVSDGRDQGAGVLYITVHPRGALEPTLDPLIVNAAVQTETTIDLAPYVHGSSSSPVTLVSVEAPDGASATMDGGKLIFSFRAGTPGTYYVPYDVSQGRPAASGLVRVEVSAPSEETSDPIVANDVALLDTDRTAIVDPLANDDDPMGGVLAVTDVDANPAGGLSVAVVDGRLINIFARRIPATPVEVAYTVANAHGEGRGTIVVMPPISGDENGLVRANDFEVSVRTGGIVSAPAIRHASHAEGDRLRLSHDLQPDDADGGFRGLAFVSDDAVRYQAPEEPGEYRVRYTVADDAGHTASGTVTFAVHAADADHKPAPRPQPVEAQVAAGGTVVIPIGLEGVDPDGDDVTLLGLGNRAPRFGRIVEVNADSLTYEAYPDSTGTDEFDYAVEDWTGQRAQAKVRVGVVGRRERTGVHARDDEVILRPGTDASVNVTVNDIADGELTVDPAVQAQGVADASVQGRDIRFTAPDRTGVAYITYTVRDEVGLTDTATLAIRTDPDVPIEPPTASDYRVPAASTIGKRDIEVDVSAWIANPSGSAADLTVGVHDSAAGRARATGATTIRITLTDRAGAVPYTVTNAAGLTSMAFIHVPAYGVFSPTPRPKAPQLVINAHETLTIPIADHVRVGAGKTVRIESPESVSATKSDSSGLYVDDRTLRFAPQEGYSGPASITFTATDGRADGSANGNGTPPNRAVITLPITVVGSVEAPPAFSPTTVDVSAGEPATIIDLTSLTKAPLGADAGLYRYAIAPTAQYARSLDIAVSPDGELTVFAKRDAAAGTLVPVPIDITYPAGTVHAGLTIRIVASRRPLARIGERAVRASAGTPMTIDALADAYNPFPDEPLTIVEARAEGLEGLDVRIESGGRLVVTPGGHAGEGVILASVEDGTHALERRVTATIRIAVMAAPEPPLLAPVAAAAHDGMVELHWTPGNANGSPITEYRVEYEGGSTGSRDCGTNTSCRIEGLVNGRLHRFVVKARNEVGWSAPSNTVEATPDRVPSAPRDVRTTAGYHQILVEWSPPRYEGTAPEAYAVALHGPNGFEMRIDAPAGSSQARFEIPDAAISDGVSFTATVAARNYVGEGEASGPSAPVMPWGDPEPPEVTLVRVPPVSTSPGADTGPGASPGTGSGSPSGQAKPDGPADTNGQSGSVTFGVTVTLRNLRNAGCASLSATGSGGDRRLDCRIPVNRFTFTAANAPAVNGTLTGNPATPDASITVMLETVQPGPRPVTVSAAVGPRGSALPFSRAVRSPFDAEGLPSGIRRFSGGDSAQSETMALLSAHSPALSPIQQRSLQ